MLLLEAFYRPSSSPNTVSEIYFPQKFGLGAEL